jgi:hypothetical protein
MTKRQNLGMQRRLRSKQPDQVANASRQPKASLESAFVASWPEFSTMIAGHERQTRVEHDQPALTLIADTDFRCNGPIADSWATAKQHSYHLVSAFERDGRWYQLLTPI